MAETDIVRKNCYISNDVKHAAVLKAKEKILEASTKIGSYFNTNSDSVIKTANPNN